MKYCSGEPVPELQLTCLKNASSSYEEFTKTIETNVGRRSLALCYSQLNRDSDTGFYHLISCVEEHTALYLQHPFPEFSESLFFVNNLRSKWASDCMIFGVKKASDCIKGFERSFRSTWSKYLSISNASVDDPSVRRFKICLGDDYLKSNYKNVESCLN